MRIVPILLAVLSFAIPAFAGEIREFDVKTTERLGKELVRLSKRPDRGFDSPAKKRARETAIKALEGRLYNEVRYDYVLLDDPVEEADRCKCFDLEDCGKAFATEKLKC